MIEAPAREEHSSPGIVYAGRLCALTALYVIAGRLGLLMAWHHESATLIWPPTGLSLVALILYGRRLWPGVFVGALLVNLSSVAAPASSFGIAVGNSIEAWLGALFLCRFADFRPALERVRDVMALVLIGALGCTLVSATVGVGTLWLSNALGSASPRIVWMAWWLGDIGGVVVLAPVLLMLENGDPAWRELLRRPEYWLVLGLCGLSTVLAFAGSLSGSLVGVSVFLPFPLLVWAGSRHGSRGAVTSSALVVVVATLATARGLGPFAGDDMDASLMSLWTYAIVIGATALILAAATGQREVAERRLRREMRERTASDRERVLLRERERMVREMHDGVGGQLVTALSMVERGRATGRDIAATLRNVLDDLRLVIDSLDPALHDVFAALGKLRARLEPPLRRSGIRLLWNVSGSADRLGLPPEQALNIVRIVQEAVTNAVRHAEPTQLEIRVTAPALGPTALHVIVRDNGRGIARDANQHGRGLNNMRERAQSLNGEFRIESGTRGTQVELLVPFLDPGAIEPGAEAGST